jgi:hypothetical protein
MRLPQQQRGGSRLVTTMAMVTLENSPVLHPSEIVFLRNTSETEKALYI